MKSALAALVLLVAPAMASASATKDSTITQVVRALEDMMASSKEDGNTERKLYAKYKCYCDTNSAEKTASIASLTDQIAVLTSSIEAIQGATGGLSEDVAQLAADMADNEASQASAVAVREKENKAYLALKSDLLQAMSQMTGALETLSEIGADQTTASGADHAQYMAGAGAAMVQKTHKAVRQALLAASAFVNKKQSKTVEAFLQVEAPFTGTYTAQSGEVVGILKDMRDTFRANFKDATKKEEESLKAHTSLMATLVKAYNEMDDSHSDKQGKLGSNDDELATKKSQLETAESTKADDEAFLEELTEMCDAKAKEYKNRVMMRTNEEAALAEAISILNSDEAFATFGGVSATSTGSTGAKFIQISRHSQANANSDIRKQAQGVAAALMQKKVKTAHMAKVIAMLETSENPFKTVLEEIEKMLVIIKKEEKADKEQFAWCNQERSDNNAEKTRQTGIKNGLEMDISKLNEEIDNPETGLKASIESLEIGLAENDKSQKSETKQRSEDNQAYQKDIANLVAAEELLDKAIKVLTAYYSQLEGAFLQKAGDSPAPPSTWKEGAYEGRSTEGTGAIEMLTFILSETKKEEATAHDDEKSSQHDFEDSMAALTTEENNLRKSLANDQQLLDRKSVV